MLMKVWRGFFLTRLEDIFYGKAPNFTFFRNIAARGSFVTTMSRFPRSLMKLLQSGPG